MFLELLTPDQQQLFLDAAMTVAHADQHLDPSEQAFLERMVQEVGGTTRAPVVLTHAELVEATAKVFASSSGIQPRAFMLELAGMTVADGDQSDAELTLLHEIADAAGVPAADVPVFLDFAERTIELAAEAQDLLARSNLETP
jgi:uncharacterized tellurite resistance protein B-like protein